MAKPTTPRTARRPIAVTRRFGPTPRRNKLLGLPMGVDVCYTNHAEADSDDMDTLLTLLAVAGCTYVITVPGADDVMLGYQSLSYHDALYVRSALGLRPAPEFERWLDGLGMLDASGNVLAVEQSPLLAITS